MRPWIVLGVVAVAGTACHSATAPTPTQQTWNYQAGELTDGVVTCIFGAAMSLTQTSGPFTGAYQNGYMSCSGPDGASSTVVTGTVDAGTVASSNVGFTFTNSDVTNSGEIDETTVSYTNTGTIIDNDTVMNGTATVTITLGGVSHTLTGAWTAQFQ